MLTCFVKEAANPIKICVVLATQADVWLSKQTDLVKNWLSATRFRFEANAWQLVPKPTGQIDFVVCVMDDFKNFWSVGHLPYSLPEAIYQFDVPAEIYPGLALAFGLGAYQFTRYKSSRRQPAQLYLPFADTQIHNMVESIYHVRDWINTPTEDLGPSEFAAITKKLAKEYEASYTEIIGEELLKQNYPAIHVVGRASDDPPRLLDLIWGKAHHPKITLVGKGVCFDSGGLDLKPARDMLLMKKDMGGAAHVLGLARMIMQANLPIRLRVLIPVVENVISGNAYRPGDVIKSRKGLHIEIGNTDAEGRVILADALTKAVEDKPTLLIDMSTLTGAARVALGTELPVIFANNDVLMAELMKHGNKQRDPMWPLPLHAPYRDYIESSIADINNNSQEPYGGAITAALFLKAFVPDDIPWLHFDLMAWNLRARPGRPQGGEAMGLRALFSYLQERFNT